MRVVRLVVLSTLLTVTPGCGWLHSGTPAANAASQVIDCAEAGIQASIAKALPDVIALLISAASGGGLSWTGLAAALGGMETLIANGVVIVTCAVEAAATYLAALSAPSSQPTKMLKATRDPSTSAVAAKLGRVYLESVHRAVAKRAVAQ